jgi:glucokinase
VHEQEFSIMGECDDMAKKKRDLAIGVDLGGTNIRAALVSPDGLEGRMLSIPTKAVEGPEAIVISISGLIKRLTAQLPQGSKIEGIGIGAPGPLNARTGIIETMPNLPKWENIAFKAMAENEFKERVELLNDADAAAWGEYCYGAAQGMEEFALLTLGTGLGSSFFIKGRPWIGASGISPELGHIPIARSHEPCSCGGFGHLESYLSSRYLVKSAKKMIERGEKSAIDLELLDAEGFHVEEIIGRARDADRVAQKIIRKYGEALGQAFSIIANLFNMSLVVLSGGISAAWDVLKPFAMKEFFHQAFRTQAEALRIEISSLQGTSGVLGAGAMILNALPLD